MELQPFGSVTEMTDYKATPEQWAQVERDGWVALRNCLVELRARVEDLEAEANEYSSSAHFCFEAIIKRLEALEAGATCPHIVSSDEGTSYCGLAEQMANAKPTPNPSQIRSSLVLVRDWISSRGCAKSSAYKWLGILGIRPRREVNRATGKVESWLTDEQAATLTAYAEALSSGHKSPDAIALAKAQSSLVKLVASAISRCDDSAAWDDEAVNWTPEARAAIRAVVEWLIDRKRQDDWLAPFDEVAKLLEQEVER